MIEVKNYVCGQWVAGEGTETTIYNAITGDQIGAVSSAGIDFEAVLNYGTFKDVGELIVILGIKKMAAIFNNQLKQKRTNYSPKIANYFKLYFKKYATS